MEEALGRGGGKTGEKHFAMRLFASENHQDAQLYQEGGNEGALHDSTSNWRRQS